jgi:threonine dehydratase
MVQEAAERIAGRARRTPVIDWSVRAQGHQVDVTLKLELLQHVGSFKPRGAFNRILSAPALPELVVAASGGNHGLAVAYAARELGLRAAVYVPVTAPKVKVDGIRALGAGTVLVGNSYADAAEASYERAGEPEALYVHPYDQSEVVAGQGTVGMELDQQAPELTTVLVATGGGGLIGGIAAWFGRRAQVVRWSLTVRPPCTRPLPPVPRWTSRWAAWRPTRSELAVSGYMVSSAPRPRT